MPTDPFVGGAIPKKGNLVARYHGTGAHRPLLSLAHTDVVEARREDWTRFNSSMRFGENRNSSG
jgi:acetylornithine deacetylase/succinyl-diaminopimelate desuccinylase-like protein